MTTTTMTTTTATTTTATMKLTLLAALLAGFALASCDCDGLVCGDGTTQVGTECRPDDDGGNEGEGEGEGEGDGGVVCGPGTINIAGECVPQCRADQVFTNGACACAGGTVDNGAGACVVNPGLCLAGTVFSEADQACVPLAAAAPGDDEVNGGAPPTITLPAPDEKPAEIGGVLDALPGVFDLDFFELTGTAGQRLQISAVPFGAPSVAFAIAGLEEVGSGNNIEGYLRIGFPGEGRTAFRDVVLPLDGQYTIIVADPDVLLAAIFGTPAPVVVQAGPDYDYTLVVDTLEPLTPTVVGVGTLPGNFLAPEQRRINDQQVAVGNFISTSLIDFADTIIATPWIVADGVYVEALDPAAFLFAQEGGGGAVVTTDFLIALDAAAPTTFNIVIDDRPIVSGPGENQGLQDFDTLGDDEAFFAVTLSENNVYRVRVQFPETSSVCAPTGFGCADIVDDALQVIGQCDAVNFDAAIDGRELECRVRGDSQNQGTAFIHVIDTVQGGIGNNQLRLSIDEATVVQPPLSIGLGDADIQQTQAVPADVDPDAWDGPWFSVSSADLQQTVTSSSNGVLLNLFNASGFARVATGVATNTRATLPGDTVLVQATGGPGGAATFVLTVEANALPFLIETEPNDSELTANVLAEDTNLVGAVFAGAFDFIQIDTPAEGLLAVTLAGPPGGSGLPNAFGDVVEILDENGVVIGGPSATVAQSFGPAGTYFARVSTAGAPGAYTISWTFTAGGEPPGSCVTPTPAQVGDNDGDNGIGQALFIPEDIACIVNGFGDTPDNFAGREAVFSFTIPEGFRLDADVIASFDSMVAILRDDGDGTCDPFACLAGADQAFNNESVTFTNDTGADLDVLIVVEGFAGATGTFTLTLTLTANNCAVGASQCGLDGNVESCVDGSAFVETENCNGAGCLFDDFNLTASCDIRCGPGSAVDPRSSFCQADGTLQVCNANGTAFDAQTCAGECVGVVDADGGFCSFGLCAVPQLGSTTCLTEDRFGDPGELETFLFTCNADASTTTRAACDVGEACNGDTCVTGVGTPQVICDAGVTACAASVLSACNVDGNVEDETFCVDDCNFDNSACGIGIFGESCADAGLLASVALPAPGGSVQLTGTTTGRVDDHDGACEFPAAGNPFAGPDLVASFVADADGDVDLTIVGYDAVIYAYENTCPAAVEADCADDFDLTGTEAITIPVVTGNRYFIVVDTFANDDFAGDFTLTISR